MNKKTLIIGPCAAESEAQMEKVVQSLQAVLHKPSAQKFEFLLRAGLWKPRSSPNSFQGLGSVGLRSLVDSAYSLGLPAITEVAQPEHLRAAHDAGIRHFWIGARTTSNPFMVEALASTPIEGKEDITWLVKNPTSPDIDLWCGAVERMRAAGYTRIGAIHRGFAMGEHTTSSYRNAPMWSVAIDFKRRYPDLPLITDVSHIAGSADFVAGLAEQSLRMGVDGLMIEVHPCPAEALSDAAQQLTPEALGNLIERLADIPLQSQSDEQNELAVLRQQIDETDDELWALVSKRMDISRRIGIYKREKGIPVLQSGRYNELLARRMQWAKEHGISPEAAKQVMDIIHEQSVLQQI